MPESRDSVFDCEAPASGDRAFVIQNRIVCGIAAVEKMFEFIAATSKCARIEHGEAGIPVGSLIGSGFHQLSVPSALHFRLEAPPVAVTSRLSHSRCDTLLGLIEAIDSGYLMVPVAG